MWIERILKKILRIIQGRLWREFWRDINKNLGRLLKTEFWLDSCLVSDVSPARSDDQNAANIMKKNLNRLRLESSEESYVTGYWWEICEIMRYSWWILKNCLGSSSCLPWVSMKKKNRNKSLKFCNWTWVSVQWSNTSKILKFNIR